MGSWCWKRFTECIRPTKTQEKVSGRSLPSTWPKGDVFDLIKLLKNTDFTIFLHLVYTPNTWLLHKHRQVYWQLATPLEVFIIHHRPWRDHLREGNFGQHYKCIVKGRHAALWTWQGKSYSGYWTHHPDVLEDDPVLHINLWTNWRLTYGFSFDLCPVPSLKKFGTEPTIPPFQPWTFLPAFVRGQQTCLADPSWNYEISFTNFLILRQPHYFRNPTKSFWTFASSSSPSPFATALHATSTMSWYHFFRHHHWQYNSRVFYLDYFWSPNVRTLILNGLPVLGAMMKQVCWHSRRSKAYRGLPEKPRTKRGSRELESIYYGGTPMRHRKTACFGALVLEPHFAQILRPLLATYMGEGFGGSRFRVLYGGEIYCRFWRASWTTSSSSAKRCDRHLNCVALACRCNSSLFSDVGPLETIAENKTEQKSAAKRRQRLLKAPQQPPS